MDIKSAYEKLRKNYDLPKYEALDEEFELLYLHNVLEIKYPLRFIRRRIMDKIANIIHFFEGVLNPAADNIINLQENGYLNEGEKDELANILKYLISLERESMVLDIEFGEEKDAGFIKKVMYKWTAYKPKLANFTKKLIDGWEKDRKEEGEKHYFG